jgi:hypothetical protein
VRKNLAPWLWMYKHWRYLPARPDRPYRFYANFSDRSKTCFNRTKRSNQKQKAATLIKRDGSLLL